MNTGSCTPSIPFRSIQRLIQSVLSQLTFSFYRHGRIQADFSGGQLSSDGGLLPLRAFDQRYRLTASVAEQLLDRRQTSRIEHSQLALLRLRLYGIIAGYEDANDAERLCLDPVFQMLADSPLDRRLGSQPTLSRWENSITAGEVVELNRLLLDWFVRLCGRQVRRRGEILLDIDSTNDPTHGHQQLSLFNGHFGETVYHPLLVFERHTGCLLSARLRRGNCVSYNRVVPVLRPVLEKLRQSFPGIRIRLRADAGFAVPELYELLEKYEVEYVIRFTTHGFLKRRLAVLEQTIREEHQRTGEPASIYGSLRHPARRWSRARRICFQVQYPGDRPTLRCIITNLELSSQQVCEFYNGRGECENRIEELKNGFHADRLSCHRFVANCFRLLLHGLAYNLVNLFRLRHLPRPWRSLQIEVLRTRFFKLAARVRQTARCLRIHWATGWPFQSIFYKIAAATAGG
jgi:DDE family transposase